MNAPIAPLVILGSLMLAVAQPGAAAPQALQAPLTGCVSNPAGNRKHSRDIGEIANLIVAQAVRAWSTRSAELVEQLAISGRSLQSQGSMLFDRVGQFRLS
jgi:hypothetical protein